MPKFFKDNPLVVTVVAVVLILLVAARLEYGSFAPSQEERVLEYAQKRGFRYIEPTWKRPREQINLRGVHIPREGLKYAFKSMVLLMNLPPVCVDIATDKNSATVTFQRKNTGSMELFTKPRGKIGLIYISSQGKNRNCTNYGFAPIY